MGGLAVALFTIKGKSKNNCKPESKEDFFSSPTSQTEIINMLLMKSILDTCMQRVKQRFSHQSQVKIVYVKSSHTSDREQQKDTGKESKRLLPSLHEKE